MMDEKLPSFFGASKIARTDLSSRVEELVFTQATCPSSCDDGRLMDVIEPTEDELRQGVRNALDHCGFTYAELAEQSQRGQYASLEARLAWMAVRNLGDLVD